MARTAVFSTLTLCISYGLAACGGKILDTGGGAAGSTTTGGAAGSGSTRTCDQGCGSGSECFPPNNARGGGTCAPLCDSQDQSEIGKPCPNPVSGGNGICLPFDRQPQDMRSGIRSVSVCTGTCSPLLQDCPEHFACDVTEEGAALMPRRIFACLPVVESPPRSLGASCEGFPLGQCAPGLSCIPAVVPGSFANCLALCDLLNSTSCTKPGTCSRPEWFPPELNVGVCSL
jgi:hypothetical protein